MSTIYLIFLIIFNTFLICFVIYTVYANLSGAPYLPTRKKHVHTMLRLANVKKGEKLMDLGSGDGRIVLIAARQGIHATGIEINPVLYYWAQIKRIFQKDTQLITFKRENLWDVDLSDVDVLTLFFIKPKMDKLLKKIQTEMKPGSRVVSHIFTFDGWQHEKKHGTIYVYENKS